MVDAGFALVAAHASARPHLRMKWPSTAGRALFGDAWGPPDATPTCSTIVDDNLALDRTGVPPGDEGKLSQSRLSPERRG